MDDFDKLLEDVEKLDVELSDPRPFFEEVRGEYLIAAKRVAVAVMTAQRPPDVKVEDWQRRVDRVADRVTAQLLAFGGLVLRVRDAGEPSGALLPPVEQRSSYQAITFADVKEWIRAGQRGEAGGKRITAADEAKIRERGVDAVAADVMKAYFSREPKANYGRLRAAIQRYLIGGQGESDPSMEAIAAAWKEHFTPVLHRDLSDWAAGVVRRF